MKHEHPATIPSPSGTSPSPLWAQGENERVEFKTSFNTAAIETLVAFANRKGGTLYIGISDAGKIVGISLAPESVQNWINEIKSKTEPSLIPDPEVIREEGKTVLALAIPEYPVKPVATQGRYYRRTGNANHLLSTSEVVNLHLFSMNSSWDFFCDTEHSLDDIDLDKVQLAIEQSNRQQPRITEDPLGFLNKCSLLRDHKLTYASYLLFTKHETPLTTIELGRFQDEITIKDSARSKVDLFTQVNQVMDFIKKHLNLEVIITGRPQNTQRWQYPLDAIREIVMNMIIHRDYRSPSSSIVKVFDNRIEFYNPGTLPEGLTIETLLSNSYVSTPRNMAIADFFKHLGLIEKYGSGIRRILHAFKEYGLPAPRFENRGIGFMVTVYADRVPDRVPDKVPDRVPDHAMPPITDNRQQILDLLKANPRLSFMELSSALGISKRKILDNINKLKELDKLNRIGNNKTGYWEVQE